MLLGFIISVDPRVYFGVLPYSSPIRGRPVVEDLDSIPSPWLAWIRNKIDRKGVRPGSSLRDWRRGVEIEVVIASCLFDGSWLSNVSGYLCDRRFSGRSLGRCRTSA